jgi:hypothetical protein
MPPSAEIIFRLSISMSNVPRLLQYIDSNSPPNTHPLESLKTLNRGQISPTGFEYRTSYELQRRSGFDTLCGIRRRRDWQEQKT